MSITDTTTPTIADLVRASGLSDDDPIKALPGLSTRALNCLLRGGLYTIGDLSQHDDESLRDIRNFGVGCLDNVRTALAQLAEQNAEVDR
jgi:DNA-directed RNA polymerase alpha subunit